jgi:hypothetical protein
MTDPDSLKIDGFDSSVGQLGGYTSSLHALRRASCCDVQRVKALVQFARQEVILATVQIRWWWWWWLLSSLLSNAQLVPVS